MLLITEGGGKRWTAEDTLSSANSTAIEGTCGVSPVCVVSGLLRAKLNVLATLQSRYKRWGWVKYLVVDRTLDFSYDEMKVVVMRARITNKREKKPMLCQGVVF